VFLGLWIVSASAANFRDAAQMRTAHVPAELRHSPFTTAQALAYGVTSSALRRSQWRNVFRDVWVHIDVPDNRETRLAAVRLVISDLAFVCGLTAAWVYGIDVRDRRGELVWVGHRTGNRLRNRAGCLTREITAATGDLTVVDGITITTELRTAFDCGRWLSLIEAVVVADALAHAGGFTVGDLTAYTKQHRALRGVRQVDRVLELMDPLSESPMETRVRLLTVLAGLPRPQSQLIVLDVRGRFVARADLGYEVQRLIVEYDGAFHWEQRREGDRRREAIRALGWTVLVFSAEDYDKTPGATIEKVRSALAKATPKPRRAGR
jgi:hypothetical protein